MPIGYLISVLLPALATGLAVAPIRRGWTLGQLSWRVGFQINELPTLAAACVLASTLLAGEEGDLDTPVGLVGLGVSALTLAGLALILGRSLRARPAIEAALVETFGPERNRKLGVPDTRSERRPWIRCTLAPLAVRRRDVAHTRNVIYGPAGAYNLLDLYQSRSAVEGAPCLVYLHGGGYRSGKKNREARALLYHLAARGWVCVSANYRLAPTGRYPDQLIDAKRAIAWVGLNAGGYGADPTQIFVAGSSSGAHLAAMAALTANEIYLQPGFEQVDTTVAGADLPLRLLHQSHLDSTQSRVAVITSPPGPSLNATHVCCTRRSGLVRTRSSGSRVRQPASHGCPWSPRHLRRTSRRPTHLRPLPLPPLPVRHRRHRRLHRLPDAHLRRLRVIDREGSPGRLVTRR